jgi:hypothetical protein
MLIFFYSIYRRTPSDVKVSGTALPFEKSSGESSLAPITLGKNL